MASRNITGKGWYSARVIRISVAAAAIALNLALQPMRINDRHVDY
jgi:hypothetical protein